MKINIHCHWTFASFSILNIPNDAYRAVMILWANVTALLAPVDLKGATAADLTHGLMWGLVHTCSKPDGTWTDIQVLLVTASDCAAFNLCDYLAGKACSLWKQFEVLLFLLDTPGTHCKQWSCSRYKNTNILYVTWLHQVLQM